MQANPAKVIAITHHAVSCRLRRIHINKYKRSQFRAYTMLAPILQFAMRAEPLASAISPARADPVFASLGLTALLAPVPLNTMKTNASALTLLAHSLPFSKVACKKR